MTYTFDITVFKDLIARYPTWNDLRDYLESVDGGMFRDVDNAGRFCLIRYDKGVTNMSLPRSKWFLIAVGYRSDTF